MLLNYVLVFSICRYSGLFATIRDYSGFYKLFNTACICPCSESLRKQGKNAARKALARERKISADFHVNPFPVLGIIILNRNCFQFLVFLEFSLTHTASFVIIRFFFSSRSSRRLK